MKILAGEDRETEEEVEDKENQNKSTWAQAMLAKGLFEDEGALHRKKTTDSLLRSAELAMFQIQIRTMTPKF